MKRTAFLAVLASFLIVPLLLATGVRAQDDSWDTWSDDSWSDESWDNWGDSWDDESWGDDGWVTTYDSDFPMEEGLGAIFGAMSFVFIAIYGCVMLGVYIYYALALSTIAKKVGEDNTWMAWIPVLNFFYMCKVAGLNMLLGLLMFVPLVNFIFSIYLFMKLAERRGFPQWVGILIIVPMVGIAVPGYIAWANPSNGSAPAQPATPVQPATPPPAEPATPPPAPEAPPAQPKS